MFLILRARFLFITHGWGDFGYYGYSARKRMINLWHGIFIKNIGYLDSKDKNIVNPEYFKIIVSSDIEKHAMSCATDMLPKNIAVTGTPRLDKYLKNSMAENESKQTKKILYAPTFRDYLLEEPLFFNFNDFDKKDFVGFFKKHSLVKIYLRPHPDDIESIKYSEYLCKLFPENIINFSNYLCNDIDSVLHEFDVIITDYSSIYLEPLILDKPVVFVPFDKEIYTKTRGFAYDYSLVTPGPKVTTYLEFKKALESALNGAPEYKNHRKFIADMFFKHKDTNSCKRIANEVLNLKIE